MVYMCPDRQIISLYHDGELPSPWKEKLEAHLEICSSCQAALAGYVRLGDSFAALKISEKSVPAAQERVWGKLLAAEPEISGRRAQRPAPVKLRYRTITLPVPMAAAAALVVIAMFFALVGIRTRPQPQMQDMMAVANIGLDDKGIVPMQDMNSVLQYLSSQDYGDYMVIRLPETRNFSRAGEPALINAADYSRRSSSR